MYTFLKHIVLLDSLPILNIHEEIPLWMFPTLEKTYGLGVLVFQDFFLISL